MLIRCSLACVVILLPAVAHASPHVIAAYKDVGPWGTEMLLDPDEPSKPICRTIIHARAVGQHPFNLSFIVRASNTMLALFASTGGHEPAPPIIRLFVDGRLFGSLDVWNPQEPDNLAAQLIEAQFPGDTFVKELFPMLNLGKTLTVDVGNIVYGVPVEGFGTVMQQMGRCATDAQRYLNRH